MGAEISQGGTCCSADRPEKAADKIASPPVGFIEEGRGARGGNEEVRPFWFFCCPLRVFVDRVGLRFCRRCIAKPRDCRWAFA